MPKRQKPLTRIGHLIAEAVDLFPSQRALAEAMGCTQQQIAYLLTAKSISVEMSSKVHSATSGKVSKYDLRPDFFKRPVKREQTEAAA